MAKKRTPEENFKYNLKARYNITPEKYYEVLADQQNKCAICGKDQKDEKRRFAVDHNHKTEFIRGLLCNYCNSKLMMFIRDDKNRAMGLAEYLDGAIRWDIQWE